MIKHNYAIDMLRFFAAFIVVLFHLNQAAPVTGNVYKTLIKFGYLGVPIFFVISGYCIAISAQESNNWKEFALKRIFRIYPAYWTSLFIVILAACFQKVHTGTNSVENIPTHLTAILATLGLATKPLTHVNTINWVYWTLTCEVLFYLMMSILLLFKNKLIYLLTILSIIQAVIPIPNIGILFFLEQWPLFGLGLSIYYYFKNTTIKSWYSFALLISTNILSLFFRFGFSGYTYSGLLCGLIIFTSNYITVPSNIFSRLGKYSYTVYLIHVPIGIFVFSIFRTRYIEINLLANLCYDIGVYVIVSLAAGLIYKVIEYPGIKYGQKIAAKYLKN